jgi:hypothetical protein
MIITYYVSKLKELQLPLHSGNSHEPFNYAITIRVAKYTFFKKNSSSTLRNSNLSQIELF